MAYGNNVNLQNPSASLIQSGGQPLWGVSGLQGDQAGTVAQNYMEDPQAVLQRVLQYDPNAHLAPFTYYGSEGVENRQQVVFDQSKLPQPKMPGTVFAGPTPLFNPNAVTQDPNYGEMTSPLNVNANKNSSTWLDIVGPLIVGGAMGLGAGGFSAISGLMSRLPNVASIVSNAFQPSQQIDPQQLALYRMLSQNRG